MSNRSRWRVMKPGDSSGAGVCTCAACLRAIDRGEDVVCSGCVEEMAATAYANGRADVRGEVEDG